MTALLFTVLASPSWAAVACYTPSQLEAEHLLRLHSELMVITVTCRQGSEGQDLAAAYGNFTKKNIVVLHDAEQTMTAYYKKNRSGNPVDHLDRLRTLLGNEYGQKSADMSAPAFCAAYRDKVVQFETASPDMLSSELQIMKATIRPYAKPCASSKSSGTKKGK
jgi:hypothetical protein